jgi:hypothetical protein
LNNILIATSGVIITILGRLSGSQLLPMLAFGAVILLGILNANLLTGAIQTQYSQEITASPPGKKSFDIVQLHPLHTTLAGLILNMQFIAFILGTMSVILASFMPAS